MRGEDLIALAQPDQARRPPRGTGRDQPVAKDPASPYIDGRTLRWLKVKQAKYREGERGWGRASIRVAPSGENRRYHVQRVRVANSGGVIGFNSLIYGLLIPLLSRLSALYFQVKDRSIVQ